MSDSNEKMLDDVDRAREGLIKKLPWYKRIYRRYFTGDAFWAYNISSLMTWPQAFAAGLLSAKLWAGWVVKYPAATSALAKGWGWVTSAAAGAWGIFSHSQ